MTSVRGHCRGKNTCVTAQELNSHTAYAGLARIPHTVAVRIPPDRVPHRVGAHHASVQCLILEVGGADVSVGGRYQIGCALSQFEDRRPSGRRISVGIKRRVASRGPLRESAVRWQTCELKAITPARQIGELIATSRIGGRCRYHVARSGEQRDRC